MAAERIMAMGLRHALAGDVRGRAVDGLEDGAVLAVVPAGGQTEAADETGREIAHDVAV